MNFFNIFLKSSKPVSRPDFIYQKNGNSLTKINFLNNTILGTYPVSNFLTHTDNSKKEVANKNSINIIDRLFGTKKYQEYAKSVKGFYNEEKVWKILSKKYYILFSQVLDHQGVDILLSKDNKNFFGFQIKSSDYYAQHFRQSGKFYNVHGIIIVGKKLDSNSITLQVKKTIDHFHFS